MSVVNSRTMEAKYGLLFCSRVPSCTEKTACMSFFVSFLFFLFAIFAGPRFVEIQEFCYHGNVT